MVFPVHLCIDVPSKSTSKPSAASSSESSKRLVDLLNPQRIALGGVFMRAEALLREEMENVLRRECLPRALAAVRIVPAQLGEQIGDYGAVTAALAAAENR